MTPPHRFAPASPSETIVFGAQRPGYEKEKLSREDVADWISFMKDQGIRRVCCLLERHAVKAYSPSLVRQYRRAFGRENVLWAPIRDFHLSTKENMQERILPFLDAAARDVSPVVIHCAGGKGRTGHVLAAWLVQRRGFSFDAALDALRELYRDPTEAVEDGKATREQLRAIVCGEDCPLQ